MPEFLEAFSLTSKTIAIHFLLFLSFTGFAQKNPNDVFLDSAKVIRIAKWRNAYWSNGYSPNPALQLDAVLQEWQVVSTKMRHTNKGKCKFTNGCTEITRLTLILEAKTGKVKSKTKQKKLFYNYE
jgi:hypothetical protein